MSKGNAHGLLGGTLHAGIPKTENIDRWTTG